MYSEAVSYSGYLASRPNWSITSTVCYGFVLKGVVIRTISKTVLVTFDISPNSGGGPDAKCNLSLPWK